MHGKGYDARYDEFVKCAACGHTWQLLDWGCALHTLHHSGAPPPAVPLAEQQRVTESAAQHGVALQWR